MSGFTLPVKPPPPVGPAPIPPVAAPVGREQIIDTKCVRIPHKWDGDKLKWKNFRRQLIGYVSGLSSEMKRCMDYFEKNPDTPVNHATLRSTPQQID